jgi:anti-sigma B factor antagonist
MTITVQEIEGKLVAVLVGELDTAAASAAELALQPLMESGGKDIIIDCTQLEYIASSGLRLFLSVLKRAREVGSHVVLRNVNDVVHDVMELTGFSTIFEFE